MFSLIGKVTNNKVTFDKSLFYLVLFFIASISSLHSLSFIASWYDEKRLAQVIIFTALTTVVITSSSLQTYFKCFWESLPIRNKLIIFTFFIIGIISSYSAVLSSWAFTEVGSYFLLLLLSLFVAYFIQKNENSDKLVIYAFIISVALYFIAFLASLIAGLISGVIDYQILISGFINRRFLNQYQSISFPILLLAPLLFNINKRTYIGLSLLAAFWFMLILVSDGRGAFVASISGIIIGSILISYQRKKWLLHAAFVITLGTLLFLAFNYLLSTQEVISGDITRGSTGGRLPIWLSVITLIQEAPFLGLGPMHYSIVPHEFNQVAHPHNITLQLMNEWGIPAALCLIYVVFSGFTQWVKQQRMISNSPKSSLIPTALTASFIAAMIHGHLSGIFVMPLSQLSFALISGWMIGVYRTNSLTESSESIPLRASQVIILCTVLSLAFLLNGSYPHIKSLITGEVPSRIYLDGKYPAANAPRYWSTTSIKDVEP